LRRRSLPISPPKKQNHSLRKRGSSACRWSYIEKQLDSVSHVSKPEGPFAPINQFAHYREFPDASNRTVVGLNVDTLYSLAGLEFAQEPMVLSIPEMGDRYWLMQLIDAWIPTGVRISMGRSSR
jgi:hypothetical protein